MSGYDYSQEDANEMLEAADKRIAALAAEVHEGLQQYDRQGFRLHAKIRALEAALLEIYEVYAGSDGFLPQYASEAYQQRLIKQMADIASATFTAETVTKLLNCDCPNGSYDKKHRDDCPLKLPAETKVECQHDKFKPNSTLQWLGSSMDINANTHLWRCTVCDHRFDLPTAHASKTPAETGTKSVRTRFSAVSKEHLCAHPQCGLTLSQHDERGCCPETSCKHTAVAQEASGDFYCLGCNKGLPDYKAAVGHLYCEVPKEMKTNFALGDSVRVGTHMAVKKRHGWYVKALPTENTDLYILENIGGGRICALEQDFTGPCPTCGGSRMVASVTGHLTVPCPDCVTSKITGEQ
jgi:hypothetical protein